MSSVMDFSGMSKKQIVYFLIGGTAVWFLFMATQTLLDTEPSYSLVGMEYDLDGASDDTAHEIDREMKEVTARSKEVKTESGDRMPNENSELFDMPEENDKSFVEIRKEPTSGTSSKSDEQFDNVSESMPSTGPEADAQIYNQIREAMFNNGSSMTQLNPAKPDNVGVKIDHATKNTTSYSSKPSDLSNKDSDEYKTIILWTAKIGDPTWGISNGSVMFSRCEYSKCLISTDKSQVAEASMLIFYLYETPNFPPVRYPRQLYAHYTKDPPRPLTETRIDVYSDVINMTINYRRDSTIYAPYGVLTPRPVIKTGPVVPEIPVTSRNQSIVWMVSHCQAMSKRDDYVKELRKYIDVSIYGRCGNLTCPKTLGYTACIERFVGQYKFYLALENNICKDYFSEKSLNIFKVDIVPIVLGGADYVREFPPHSVINARDFDSPEHLAEHLHYLSSNEQAYNKYFQWKNKYVMRNPQMYCDMCKFLHDSPYSRGEDVIPPHKVAGMSLREWWAGPTACNNGLMDDMRRKQHW